jgi:tRNA threonylcarbamoyladenosine biosynthesis protein TsaB
MRTLSIELSGETGSLALVEDRRIVLEKVWPGEPRQRRPVFSDLLTLVQEGTIELSRIDRFAVGVGPGAFSGLRLAVSLVQSLALPDLRPVTAVSSARALARSVLQETGAPQVVVLGDARRNELWAGAFGVVDGIVQLLHEDWVVAPATHLPENLARPRTVWVSADWGRLSPVLEANCPQAVELIREARLPGAAMVAGLVEDLVGRGLEGEPLVPIYVHPAVSIAPRY